jgi:hypothetical protein
MRRASSVPEIGHAHPPSPRMHNYHGAPQVYKESSTRRQTVRLTEEEIDQMMETFAKEDDYKVKTWSRRVVEGFLSKVSLTKAANVMTNINE